VDTSNALPIMIAPPGANHVVPVPSTPAKDSEKYVF